MNIDIKDIKPKARASYNWLRSHKTFITAIAIILLFGWLVLQINLLSRREPSDEKVAEKLQTIKRPKVDQATIDKIQQLQDASVDVQSIFKQARDNPFQE